jgi:hydrophobic/amphiphilic exporter-1 (mainly G- bacteria), HAE1 family
VPKGFIPDQDNDSLNINMLAAQGTSFYEMSANARKIADVIRRNPYVDSFFVSTGGGFGAMNTARFNVQLTPRRSRPLTAAQIAQQVRPQILLFPGFRTFVTLPPALQIGGRMTNSAYNITVQSADTDALYGWAARLEDAITRLPEVQKKNAIMQIDFAGRLGRSPDEEPAREPHDPDQHDEADKRIDIQLVAEQRSRPNGSTGKHLPKRSTKDA